ncbi:phage/plasmid replication protein, II/X family [Acinetobacter baumannii]|uniref:phage/plasmid replication protein, II/X family n=4 Tax=Acinetobacter baumannii TaxID=470 RepID=UPI00112BE0A8|nr:phage/plasmid replication protein, II/X family [Acinetobacter baumannii]MBD0456528.1 hypothetical protein [Acinetobacter baumannii]MCP9171381.1 phage/plasmid replication protein, II/X family [Acinetobacter baumannii]MCR0011574.1 phage/plasmid replication protein, II/X family [Acinetobacter baumannii]MCT9340377.1 phage/plasmid replication protein, II/X family [Acinetobacter baumannii]MCZ3354832.1 phage/plasmid replication protein, II/X family [Acinetobacter baumannii]
MKKNKLEIDYLEVVVDINHKPEEVASCYQIVSDEKYNFDESKIKYRSKKILSEFDSIITLQSFSLLNDYNSKLKISGNFYKWLNGHNVTGCENLIDLVLQTIEKLKNLNLVDPTKEQLETIRLGNFRLYRVDVKRDLVFDSKQNAIQYLSTLRNLSTYPKQKKTIFENGIYFGFTSKRWSICNYHKGQEVRDNYKRSKTNLELQALADLMIRQEIRIQSKQLATWELRFGHQWRDLNNIENFFKNILDKIYIPAINLKDSKNNICDKSDRKFYNCVINGDHKEVYSRATISRKRRIFLDKYNIDINNV